MSIGSSMQVGSRALTGACVLALLVGCGGTSSTATGSGSGGAGGSATASASDATTGAGGGSGTTSGTSGASTTSTSGSGGMPPVDPRCHAVHFDGTKSIVAAPAIDAYNPGASFTVEAWVYPETYPLPNQFGIVAGHNAGVLNKPSYNLAIDSSGHAVFGFSADGSKIISATTGNKIQLNKWTRVAGVFDATHSIYAFIADADMAAAGTMASKVFVIDSVPFDIGRESDGTTTLNPFTGWIDEVRLSSVARYTKLNQFKADPLPLASDASTIALYHFDESMGQSTADSSVNANTAVLYPNAMFGGPPTCPPP